MTIDYEPITPPGKLGALQELRLPVDMLRWAPSVLTMKFRRAAHPHTAILLPGFGTGPRSMRVMESFLRRRGHRVRDWGLGVNTAMPGSFARSWGTSSRTRSLHTANPSYSSAGAWAATSLVSSRASIRQACAGSSRSAARSSAARAIRPRRNGIGHRATISHAIERAVKDRYATPLRVPVTAIYSKRDGIVAWQACIDKWSPDVRHVEVSETHVGLGFSPRVLGLVANEVERD